MSLDLNHDRLVNFDDFFIFADSFGELLPITVKTPADTHHEMILISEGNFQMGGRTQLSNYGSSDELPIHTVFLDVFYIDKYEVTNLQYQAFVQATGKEQPEYADWIRFNDPQQPVVGVNWFDARDYCDWAGFRLPTEAEWEKAARGADDRTYPWGNEPQDCDRAVIYGNDDEDGAGCGKKSTWVVGSKPAGASPFGVLDMAGNVWEWVADWYGSDYYPISPQRNPKGPDVGTSRAMRGGSWRPYGVEAIYRGYTNPMSRSWNIGFRCTRDK